jgi:uroporphyrinogen decarboxylase
LRLREALQRRVAPLVSPLVGYPGARLTGTTVRENVFDAAIHTNTIRQLWEEYQYDIVFPMMDLAVEAGALGLRVRYPENESPTVEEHPVAMEADLERFRDVDVLSDARLQSFLETIRRLKSTVDAVHGAYVVGPFTLAGLMMGASEIARATIRCPEQVRRLVDFTTNVVRTYAEACQSAGAELIVFLEPTAVMLSPKSFMEFSGDAIFQLAYGSKVWTVLHICGDTERLIPAMCRTGVDALSLDSAVDLPAIALTVPSEVVLIGNVDPVTVMGSSDPRRVSNAVRELCKGMSRHPRFILSTGCDLPLETPLANVTAFMEEGRRERCG